MRVVLDTNITVSGLLWRGAPRRIIEAALNDQIAIFSCSELLEELEDVLQRPKLALRLAQIGKTASELIDEYLALVMIMRIVPLAAPVSIDPDDDIVLACALVAHADAIVSGDDDLLRIGTFADISILTVHEMLIRLDDQQ